jgi:hypothetical protein
MAPLFRYALAILPAAITVSAWQVANFLYAQGRCQGGLKGLSDCKLQGYDITGLMGIGLFWCHLLSWFTVPISILLVLVMLERDQKRRRQEN